MSLQRRSEMAAAVEQGRLAQDIGGDILAGPASEFVRTERRKSAFPLAALREARRKFAPTSLRKGKTDDKHSSGAAIYPGWRDLRRPIGLERRGSASELLRTFDPARAAWRKCCRGCVAVMNARPISSRRRGSNCIALGFPISVSVATCCVCLELRPLPRWSYPFSRYHEPLRHPRGTAC